MSNTVDGDGGGNGDTSGYCTAGDGCRDGFRRGRWFGSLTAAAAGGSTNDDDGGSASSADEDDDEADAAEEDATAAAAGDGCRD